MDICDVKVRIGGGFSGIVFYCFNKLGCFGCNNFFGISIIC